jgi:hypothetical protein
MTITTIGTFAVERESTALVYDAQTGEVVYVHHFVTFKGGQHPDEKTAEMNALAELKRIRPKLTAKTAVLHVAPSAIKPDTGYKIDVAKRVLVAQPRKRAAKS